MSFQICIVIVLDDQQTYLDFVVSCEICVGFKNLRARALTYYNSST